MTTDTTILAARVRARQIFVERILREVQDLTVRHGQLVAREASESHTCTTWELRFGRFYFRCKLGQTAMGGNDIAVWYRPRSGESDPRRDPPVFDAYYQSSPSEARVSVFSEDGSWQRALSRSLRDREGILRRMKQDRAKARERLAADREARKVQQRLAADAARLGVAC